MGEGWEACHHQNCMVRKYLEKELAPEARPNIVANALTWLDFGPGQQTFPACADRLCFFSSCASCLRHGACCSGARCSEAKRAGTCSVGVSIAAGFFSSNLVEGCSTGGEGHEEASSATDEVGDERCDEA